MKGLLKRWQTTQRISAVAYFAKDGMQQQNTIRQIIKVTTRRRQNRTHEQDCFETRGELYQLYCTTCNVYVLCLTMVKTHVLEKYGKLNPYIYKENATVSTQVLTISLFFKYFFSLHVLTLFSCDCTFVLLCILFIVQWHSLKALSFVQPVPVAVFLFVAFALGQRFYIFSFYCLVDV